MSAELKTERFSETDGALLLSLQKGLPLVPRPFDAAGRELGLSEKEVLEKLQKFADEGLVRRFGAVFESRALGYDSTLCAADIPEAELEQMAARLNPHTGITHSYQREGRPTLWFTMTAPADQLAAELDGVSRLLAPHPVWSLPARRTFKIGVVLDVNQKSHDAAKNKAGASRKAISTPSAPIPENERAAVRRLQADIPLAGDVFDILARDLGITTNALLELLNDWKHRSVLRRIALIARHRELGFKANAMCVWRVAPEQIEAAGQTLATSALVTHCYERAVPTSFPYNLFAMVHAGTRDDAHKARAELTAMAGLSEGSMLVSVREFKKASPQFFI